MKRQTKLQSILKQLSTTNIGTSRKHILQYTKASRSTNLDAKPFATPEAHAKWWIYMRSIFSRRSYFSVTPNPFTTSIFSFARLKSPTILKPLHESHHRPTSLQTCSRNSQTTPKTAYWMQISNTRALHELIIGLSWSNPNRGHEIKIILPRILIIYAYRLLFSPVCRPEESTTLHPESGTNKQTSAPEPNAQRWTELLDPCRRNSSETTDLEARIYLPYRVEKFRSWAALYKRKWVGDVTGCVYLGEGRGLGFACHGRGSLEASRDGGCERVGDGDQQNDTRRGWRLPAMA